MSPDKLAVTLFGILGIIFTAWFFLFKKEREVKAMDSIDIIVSGGYSPNVVVVPKGKTTKLNFIRKDANECLSEIVLGDFKIKKELPLNQKVIVEITPQKSGEYGFACGMNMFHGKIIVRD